MAAKIQRKKTLKVIGIMDARESGEVFIEIEGEPRKLSDLAADFNGEEVTINIGQSDDLD